MSQFRFDVTDANATRSAIESVASDLAPPDLIFNNAGVRGAFAPAHLYPLDDAAHVVNVKVAAADIVRSSLLMWSEAAVGHLPCVDPSLIDDVHDHYLASVSRTRRSDDEELSGWEMPVLASRLAEPGGDSIRWVTHETPRPFRSSEPTRLGLSLRSAASGPAEPPSP